MPQHEAGPDLAKAPLFHMGTLVITTTARDKFSLQQITEALRRHIRGDWGELPAEDWRENNRALKHGARILSAYSFDGQKLWVITEADRSSTTLLLPEDY